MSLIDFEGINRAALRNGRSFLQDLVPGGKFRSLEYEVRNPTRHDKNPGSFKINYKTGVWKDFASGEGGSDLILAGCLRPRNWSGRSGAEAG
jgi:putative DNA primase/helicase